jgi:protein associated with RNAse G/E
MTPIRDVIRRFDGSAEILDEDEFPEHQVRYGYPPEVISQAEPVRQVCRSWLAKVPRSAG